MSRGTIFKKILKISPWPRFVRSILLYGQNGSGRKNMAIMQFWTWSVRKIAKMQDKIKPRPARFNRKIKGAFCISDFQPCLHGASMGRKMHSTLWRSNVNWRSKLCFLASLPLAGFHSPQMTSRYVVFEVSIKLPLTRYIWESDIIGNMELERLKAGL